MQLFIAKLFLYGCMGMLLEMFFTGVHSLISGNKKATCQTYLWMLFIYGFAGLLFEWLHMHMSFSATIGAWIWGHTQNYHLVKVIVLSLNAAVYVPLIYAIEFSSGWLLKKIIGVCPWDYSYAKWGVMGLIRLDYWPYWFCAALFFDWFCNWADKLFEFIGRLS